ncbi:MAG: hypothetical protein KDC45_14305 [Bacteroidetes bacterium]|nr:hypothetical protein [Bacteroidota bacterium]
MKKLAIGLIAVILSSGCSVVRQVEEAKNFAKCEFKIVNVTEAQLGGVDIQNVRKVSDLSIKKAAKVAEVLTSKTVPFSFDLNLQVKNPNAKPAAMNKLEWILFIDDRQMITGTLDEKVSVAALQTGDFGIHMTMDLKKVMSGDSKDAMTRLIFNVAGKGDEPTHIMLKVKPWIDVAGFMLEYPGYIDIRTEFTAEQGKAIQKSAGKKIGK